MLIEIYTLSELLAKGYKIGRLEINRDPIAKAAKKKSLLDYGQFQTLTYIMAVDAIKKGLTVYDENGNVLDLESAKDYIVMIDGGNRIAAHLELLEDAKKGTVKYDKEILLMEPINKDVDIDVMLAEMNTCTTPWSGSQLIAIAASKAKLSNTNAPVLEAANKLAKDGFSLPSISIYTTLSNSLTKSVIRKATIGDFNEILKDEKKLEIGKALLESSKKAFGDEVNKRTIPGWILKMMSGDGCADKKAAKLCSFFGKLKTTEVEAIIKNKGTKSGTPKETLVHNSLDTFYASKMAKTKKSAK